MARKSRRTASGSRGVTLVTGLPQFTTRRLVAELAGADPAARLALLVPERAVPAAQRLVASLPGDPDRFQVLDGDVRKMDLGLSGPELNALAREVRVIHHMASVFHLGVDRSVAEDVNVGGTMEVLELARIAGGLERLVYYSTVGV